ncbi:MAG TPA: FkbM family methyltransferase [Candidatus Sulfotelmatobacter sp.]
MLNSALGEIVNYIPYSLRPWIKSVPGISRLQRWIVSRFLSDRPFLHTINIGPARGLRFEVSLPLDKAVWTGIYEAQFTTAIVEHVKSGDICYDIGGYRGYVSGVMALAGALNVFTFEPQPANQQAIRRLCELNPELPIKLISTALGAADESTFFKIMHDSSMGKLANSSFQADATAVGEIAVTVRRIDSLVQSREIPPPNVVKIDVEGAEVDVLSGATEMLRISRPTIFVEAHGAALEEACCQKLLQLGYKIRRIEPDIRGVESTRHLICLP